MADIAAFLVFGAQGGREKMGDTPELASSPRQGARSGQSTVAAVSIRAQFMVATSEKRPSGSALVCAQSRWQGAEAPGEGNCLRTCLR